MIILYIVYPRLTIFTATQRVVVLTKNTVYSIGFDTEAQSQYY